MGIKTLGGISSEVILSLSQATGGDGGDIFESGMASCLGVTKDDEANVSRQLPKSSSIGGLGLETFHTATRSVVVGYVILRALIFNDHCPGCRSIENIDRCCFLSSVSLEFS